MKIRIHNIAISIVDSEYSKIFKNIPEILKILEYFYINHKNKNNYYKIIGGILPEKIFLRVRYKRLFHTFIINVKPKYVIHHTDHSEFKIYTINDFTLEDSKDIYYIKNILEYKLKSIK